MEKHKALPSLDMSDPLVPQPCTQLLVCSRVISSSTLPVGPFALPLVMDAIFLPSARFLIALSYTQK